MMRDEREVLDFHILLRAMTVGVCPDDFENTRNHEAAAARINEMYRHGILTMGSDGRYVKVRRAWRSWSY